MTDFEKTIIPLINKTVEMTDIGNNTGFIGAFSKDIDNPKDGELYLAYDDNVRTEASIARAQKLNNFPEYKGQYIKFINNCPWLIYKFVCKSEDKNILNDVVHLTAKQKMRILQFWGCDDDFTNNMLIKDTLKKSSDLYIPSEDIRPILGQKHILI